MHTDLVVNCQSPRGVCEEVEKKEKTQRGFLAALGPRLPAPPFNGIVPSSSLSTP